MHKTLSFSLSLTLCNTIKTLNHSNQMHCNRHDGLHHLITQAYLHLAHAKYTLGPGLLTRASYDHRMQSQYYILSNQASFELIRHSEKTLESSVPPTLTRRKKRDSTDASDTSPATEKMRDPIHWFGYLPPSSLKEAQKYFKKGSLSARQSFTTKALEHSIQAATLSKKLSQQQSDLNALTAQIHALESEES